MTVRRKLAVCVAVLLLLATGSVVRALLDRQRVNAALQALAEVQRDQQRLASFDRAVQLRWREVRVLAELAPSPDQLNMLRERIAQLDAEFATLSDLPAAAGLAGPYAAVSDSWRTVLTRLATREPMPDLVEPRDVLDALASAVAHGNDRALAASTYVTAAQRAGDVTSLQILGVSFVCGVAVVAVLSITVTRGLSTLEDASRHMGSGNLAYRIQTSSGDEFARAGQTFNTMAAQLASAIDEAREARVQAEAALAVKSAFFRAMSHDLRTPLSAVLGYVDMIDEDVRAAGLPSTSQDVAALRRGVFVLNEMVGELLDLARLEAGRMPVAFGVVDIATLVEDVLTDLRPLLEQRGNQARREAAGVSLVTDGPKLRHVLQNLLGNACKFTDRGEIAVRARIAASAGGTPGVLLSVSDTGIGMSAEEARRIFEPFQQANASVQARFGGTGLGLAITRGYVELLEGTVAVESMPGHGTTFTVWLPDATAQQSAVA